MATTEKDDKQKAVSYQYVIESTELLELQDKFNITIGISYEEYINPAKVIDNLNVFKKHFGFELASATSGHFFKDTPAGKMTPEQSIYNAFDFEDATYLESFIYLAILNRKVVSFSGVPELSDYRMDVRDLNEQGSFRPHMFQFIEDIPERIIERSNLPIETLRDDIQMFINIFTQHTRNIAVIKASADLDDTEKNKKKNAELFKIKKLNQKIKKEIIKEVVYPKIYANEVANFLKDFLSYAFVTKRSRIPQHVRLEKDENNLDVIPNVLNQQMHRSIDELDDLLHIQNKSTVTWVNPEELIYNRVNIIAPSLTSDQKRSVYASLKSKITDEPNIPIAIIRENTVFVNNGMITFDVNSDGSLDYSFTQLNTKDRFSLYKFPTQHRVNVSYDDNVDYAFYNKQHDVTITPDFIFGHMGRKGYDVEKMAIDGSFSQKEMDKAKNEAIVRANFLMQYTLNTLLPYNDIEQMRRNFLWLRGQGNSGKTTFLNLISSMTGHENVAPMQIEDLDTNKVRFTLQNALRKMLITVDEATDGQNRINMELVKTLVTGGQIYADIKHKSQVEFRFDGSFLFTSNELPDFTDTTGGLERRLRMFEITEGYDTGNDEVNAGNAKDLSFIQTHLIYDETFKSACLKWILNKVNLYWQTPESIITASKRTVRREDDVIEFIDDKLREMIKEPIVLSTQQLYDLYVVENQMKGRNVTRIRSKTKFQTALMKLDDGIEYKENANFSKLETMNTLITMYGLMFKQHHTNMSDIRFDNVLSKQFTDAMIQREREVIDTLTNITMKSSAAGMKRSKSHMFVILPNNGMYEKGSYSSKDISSIINGRFKELKKVASDTNTLSKIIEGDYHYLPQPIKPYVPTGYNSYRLNHNGDVFEDERPTFESFSDYNIE